jgi:hypothetical protein
MWGVKKYTKRDFVFPEYWEIFPVKDVSVQVVPTPTDTQGAYGLRACVSPDGMNVAIAGNVTGYQNFAEPALFANGVVAPEWQKPLNAFLKNIYWTETSGVNPDFQQVDKNLKIRAILAMAFSNGSPHRLAYISREFVGELPPDFEQQDPYDVSKHVWQMVQDTYAVTSEYADDKKFSHLFVHKLYVTPLVGGESQTIGIVHPKRNEHFSEVDFYYRGRIHSDMNAFSLIWTDDDNGFYYKDDDGISFVSLAGVENRIYSLGKNRMFFSQLRVEKGGSISFIERNNLDIAEPSPEGGADELITINRKGQVVSRKTMAEGHQWYYLLEGVPQAVLGYTKWAYAVPEMQDKQTTVPGNYIFFVGSFKEQTIQQYRVSFQHKMPYYCIMVGFNADESQLFFTKKFNLYDVKEVLSNYQTDAPFSELVRMDIE